GSGADPSSLRAWSLPLPDRTETLGLAWRRYAGSTICVWVTTAQSLPDSLRMVVCQTWVVLPRCSGVASAVIRELTGAGPRKLVFDSMVVVRVLTGRFMMVPSAPTVSANAM